MESLETEPNREAYFSVSHLVRRLIVKNEVGEDTSYYIAVRGKDFQGKPRFQALGGGAKLAPRVAEGLQEEFGQRIKFRDGEEHDDARFTIQLPVDAFVDQTLPPEEQTEQLKNRNEFVASFLSRFTDLESGTIESSVDREVHGELQKIGLAEADLEQIQTNSVGVISPMQWKETTSNRADRPGGYFRIFHLFDMTVPASVFEQLKQNEGIKFLSDDEIQAVRLATQKGEAAAEMPDGSVIVENIFPEESNVYTHHDKS